MSVLSHTSCHRRGSINVSKTARRSRLAMKFSRWREIRPVELSKTQKRFQCLAQPRSTQLAVEPHGLTAVAPLHTLRRAEPSEANPPSPRLRRVPTSHSSTGFHPWLSAKEGKRGSKQAMLLPVVTLRYPTFRSCDRASTGSIPSSRRRGSCPPRTWPGFVQYGFSHRARRP